MISLNQYAQITIFSPKISRGTGFIHKFGNALVGAAVSLLVARWHLAIV